MQFSEWKIVFIVFVNAYIFPFKTDYWQNVM